MVGRSCPSYSVIFHLAWVIRLTWQFLTRLLGPTLRKPLRLTLFLELSPRSPALLPQRCTEVTPLPKIMTLLCIRCMELAVVTLFLLMWILVVTLIPGIPKALRMAVAFAEILILAGPSTLTWVVLSLLRYPQTMLQ